MATPKQAQTLVSYFGKKYKEKYDTAPVLNRYKARWGFDAILMDMSESKVKDLIDYYLETYSPNMHDLDWFFYNYDKLDQAKRDRDKDAVALAALREQSKKRTEEWRKKIDHDRVEGS